MKLEFKLSEKDKRLLLLLFSLIIVATSYFFIYTKNINQAKEITTSNAILQERENQLLEMQSLMKAEKVVMKGFKNKISEMEAKFPAGINTEDAIVLITNLETVADMKISSVSFSMNEQFYPNTLVDTTVSADSTGGETQTTSGQEGTTTENTATTTASTAAVAPVINLNGYKSTVTLSYQTTYGGLKKAIDFINQNSNRMNIGDVSATYDNSTGNLMGSMSIQMYSLLGTDKTYEEPIIDGIDTGLSNIFGTVEIQNIFKN